MQVGVITPQGWKGEYDGWEPAAAWDRTVELARHAEEIGFESIWVFDHFHTVPVPTDEITFESFSTLSALAMATERVRIGHMVVCTGFRNPAYTAKLTSTIDVISGGRFELEGGPLEADFPRLFRQPLALTRAEGLLLWNAGADGLILIEDAAGFDFQWQFYNSDGSRAEISA